MACLNFRLRHQERMQHTVAFFGLNDDHGAPGWRLGNEIGMDYPAAVPREMPSSPGSRSLRRDSFRKGHERRFEVHFVFFQQR
jgi:hypothetical protein